MEDEEIAFLFSAFDLESTEDLEGRLAKLETLHRMYGIEREHPVAKEWYGYKVILIFRKRLSCTLKQLQDEFSKAYPSLNVLSRQIRLAKSNPSSSPDSRSQVHTWRTFHSTNMISLPNLCQILEIMFSVAPNTGWVERAYSTLEQICPKRRNKMAVSTIRACFLLSVLDLPVKGCFDYEDTIKNAGKEFPTI